MKEKSHWDSYWNSNLTLNSFSEGESALGYQGELLAFWEDKFACLHSKSTVLDIGTGNGAIAYAAKSYANKHSFEVDVVATDIASINPTEVFAEHDDICNVLKQITFYPDTKTESLPFANSSIALITSQFALEYTDIQSAFNECHRVLQDGGSLIAVIHHANSVIAKETEAGYRFYSRCLATKNLFDLAEQLLSLAPLLQTNAANQKVVEQYKTLNSDLLNQVSVLKSECDALELEWFNDFIRHFASFLLDPMASDVKALHEFKKRVLAASERLKDQQNAALNDEDVASWSDMLASLNISQYEFDVIYLENELFGWVLTLVK